MKFENFTVGGEVVKQDDKYIVTDNRALKDLVLSSTALNVGKATSGHSHAGQEEIYFFISGDGEMQIDSERFAVKAGDIVQIEDGKFHRVFNTGLTELYFVCVFNGSRKH